MSADDVIARFIRGEIPKRDRRRDGVTTRTNYSGANERAYPTRAQAKKKRRDPGENEGREVTG